MEKLDEYKRLADNLFTSCKLSLPISQEMVFKCLMALDDLIKQIEAVEKSVRRD